MKLQIKEEGETFVLYTEQTNFRKHKVVKIADITPLLASCYPTSRRKIYLKKNKIWNWLSPISISTFKRT